MVPCVGVSFPVIKSNEQMLLLLLVHHAGAVPFDFAHYCLL